MSDDNGEGSVHGNGQADLLLDLLGEFKGRDDQDAVVGVRGEETLEVVGSVRVEAGTVDYG